VVRILKTFISWCVIGLLLAACGALKKRVSYPCPNVLILQDGKKLTNFKTGSRRDVTDILFQAEILNFQGSCNYEKRSGKWETQVDLIVRFLITQGNTTNFSTTQFKYFVVITGLENRVHGKSVFPVVGTFKEKRSTLLYEDSIRLRIPLDEPTMGEKLRIVLGMQLSPEELQYNREKQKY